MKTKLEIILAVLLVCMLMMLICLSGGSEITKASDAPEPNKIKDDIQTVRNDMYLIENDMAWQQIILEDAQKKIEKQEK